MTQADKRHGYDPKWTRFAAGAIASSSAEIFTLPIDCTKVRLQAQGMHGTGKMYNGMVDAVFKIVRNEGISALWKGVVPALYRQTSYSSLCMALYEPFRNAIGSDTEVTYSQKLAAGGLAGALSISIVNPMDVIKVRMQADKAGTLYKGVGDALQKIAKVEGISGFLKGLGPNVQRGFIVNAAELGTYDHSKQKLCNIVGDNILAHFGASCIAGFTGAAASNPVDVLKTRLMTQPTLPNGKPAFYSGMIDCGLKIVRQEGVRSLYNGFIPNWMRKGPWCVIFFMSYEQCRVVLSTETKLSI